MANLLSQANSGLAGSQGVYVGEGLPPVPTKLAAKIKRGEFIEMAELLPEFWSSTREHDHSKQEAKSRRACSVQDIFTWVQCYSLYVSVIGPQHPSRIQELMAYQANIVSGYPELHRPGVGSLQLSLQEAGSTHWIDTVFSDQPDPVYPLLRGVSENCHKMQALLHHHAPHQGVCSAGGPRPWGGRPPQGN